MDSQQLRDEIADVVRQAVLDYAEMSGMGVWDTPESWVQGKIGSALCDRFFVMLEARVRDLLEWSRLRSHHPRRPQDVEVAGGRIDVVLFGRTPDPSKAPIEGLIETKKYGQRGVCVDDAIRLRGLGAEITSVKTGIVVAYLQYPSAKALEAAKAELLHDLGVDDMHASVRKFPSEKMNGDYCASVVVEVLASHRPRRN